MADPLSTIEKKLQDDSWFHLRSYRKEQKQVTEDYWRILSFILLSSNIHTRQPITPEALQPILMNSFSQIFINIPKTKEKILDVLRGFSRRLIDRDPHRFNSFLQQHQDKLDGNCAYIHQSINASTANQGLIWRSTPEIFDLRKYDWWHTKLNQPYSAALSTHYPPELFTEDDEQSTKIVLDLQLKPELFQTWHAKTELASRSLFIMFAFERMLTFFTDYPDQPTFSEDRVI